MHSVSLLLFALAVSCEAFAYWGLSTVPGRRAFDEMAGMIPLAAAVLGALLAVAGAFAFWRGMSAAPARKGPQRE
jgi:hypothetical protein